MNKQYDSRTADKFVVRLPDGLRAQVEQSAITSDTSMNTVFIQALRQYLDTQGRQQLLLDALAAAYVRAGEKEHELRFQLHDREGSRRDWFEAAQEAEKRVVEMGGLLRGMVDAAKALKASKHGFNEQQWEQLHAAVAASDTALTPVSGGLVIGFDPGDPGGSHTVAFGESCLHEFVPFTKGCSKCGEPYSTEGTSHE